MNINYPASPALLRLFLRAVEQQLMNPVSVWANIDGGSVTALGLRPADL